MMCTYSLTLRFVCMNDIRGKPGMIFNVGDKQAHTKRLYTLRSSRGMRPLPMLPLPLPPLPLRM